MTECTCTTPTECAAEGRCIQAPAKSILVVEREGWREGAQAQGEYLAHVAMTGYAPHMADAEDGADNAYAELSISWTTSPDGTTDIALDLFEDTTALAAFLGSEGIVGLRKTDENDEFVGWQWGAADLTHAEADHHLQALERALVYTSPERRERMAEVLAHIAAERRATIRID